MLNLYRAGNLHQAAVYWYPKDGRLIEVELKFHHNYLQNLWNIYLECTCKHPANVNSPLVPTLQNSQFFSQNQ